MLPPDRRPPPTGWPPWSSAGIKRQVEPPSGASPAEVVGERGGDVRAQDRRPVGVEVDRVDVGRCVVTRASRIEDDEMGILGLRLAGERAVSEVGSVGESPRPDLGIEWRHDPEDRDLPSFGQVNEPLEVGGIDRVECPVGGNQVGDQPWVGGGWLPQRDGHRLGTEMILPGRPNPPTCRPRRRASTVERRSDTVADFESAANRW